MSWKTAHACVRGSAHLRSGLPNQDAAQCIAIPGEGSRPAIAIAAVSDGHGGVRHFRSQIGSTLAVSTAVDALQGFLLQRGPGGGAESISADDIQELERDLVVRWLAAVSTDLENHPLTAEELGNLEKGDGAESRTSVETLPTLAYGATLLVAAATDNLILYLQLGDGEILCVDGRGETTRPLPADARLVGNQTTSLCQPDAWQEFRAAWFGASDLPALVLLSTDGYANSFRSDEDFLKIGADYLEIIREQGISVLAEELPDILKEATQQGSGDDITLAILQGDLKRVAVEGNGAPVKPKISSESRSLLIEQLKARHSSQHRRLDELSTRLEETRKDNRRLLWLLALLVLIVAGAAAYVFRGYLHFSEPAKPEVKPEGATPKGQPAPPGQGASRESKRPNDASQWQLTLESGSNILLSKGATIPCGKIARCEKTDPENPKPYAEVAWLAKSKQMQLWNDLGQTWDVTGQSSGKHLKVSAGHALPLDSDTYEITFSDGVKGTISLVTNSSGSSDLENQAEGTPSIDQSSNPTDQPHAEKQ